MAETADFEAFCAGESTPAVMPTTQLWRRSCLHSPSASVHNDVTTVAHQSVERTSAHPCMVQHGHVTACDRPSASGCDGVRTVRRRCRSSTPSHVMSKGRTILKGDRSHAQLQIPPGISRRTEMVPKGLKRFLCLGRRPESINTLTFVGTIAIRNKHVVLTGAKRVTEGKGEANSRDGS